MQKDPGVLRGRDDGRPTNRHEATNAGPDAWFAFFSMVRTLSVFGVFVLLIVAAYLATSVFFQLGSLIRDPAVAKQSVQAIAEIISGDQLVIKYQEDESIEIGNLVSFLLLLFCYILWLYVPVTLISVCSRILLGTISRRKSSPSR